MEREEELIRTYQRERGDLEEQEDSIKRLIRNGEDYTQDVLSQVRQLLSKRETSMDVVRETQQAIQRVEAEYLEELNQERKKVMIQQEEVEQTYHREYQQLKG